MADNEVNVKISVSLQDGGRALDVVSDKLNSLSTLPGGVGTAIGRMSDAFSAAGQAAASAGTAASVAWGPVVLVVGAVVAAVGGLAAAFIAAGKAAGDAIQTAASWGNAIDDLQDVTGVSAEFGSTLAFAAEKSGMSVGQLQSRLAVLARKTDDAGTVAAGGIDKIGAATDKANKKLEQLAQDFAQANGDIFNRRIEQLADFNKARIRAEEDYTARMEDLARDLADTRASYAMRYADIDDKAAQERLGIESQFANANTDLGKKALAAELAALDKRTAGEKAKVSAAEQKEIDRINRQIEREQKANDRRVADFAEAQAKIELTAQQSWERQAEQYQRMVDSVNEALASTMATVGAQAAKAADKASPLEKVLGKLGINAEEFANLGEDKKLTTLFDALLKIPKGFERSAIAQEIFGRGATDMIDLLDIYEKDGWNGLVESAKAYGLYLTQDAIDEAVNYQRSVNELNLALKGLQITIGIDLMPILKTFVDKLIELWKTHGPSIISFLDRAAKVYVPVLVDAVIKLFGEIDKLFGRFEDIKNITGEQLFYGVLQGLASVDSPLRGFINALLLALQALEAMKIVPLGTFTGIKANYDAAMAQLGIQTQFYTAPNDVYGGMGFGGQAGGTTGNGGGSAKRAMGGPVFAGMPYLVGERGPEMFRPQTNGQVSNNTTTTNNYNYSPTYGSTPSNPSQDFYMMRALAGAK